MRLIPLVIAITAACAAASASAGTIFGSSSTPASATLTPNGVVMVKHDFDIKYFNNETFGCGARLTFSDGTPAENLTIKKPQDKVSKSRSYDKAGDFKATLEGFPHSGMVACLGSQTTSANIKGSSVGSAIESPSLQVQGPAVSLVKAKLTGLTLAQNVIPPSNSPAVVFNLQADRQVANCQLEYELRTNNTGVDMINLTLINPLDYGNTSANGWSLPIQGQKISFGTLMLNGQYRTGALRFVLRAKNVPNNTCTGEAYGDFEIKNTVSPVFSAGAEATLVGTSITGVQVTPNWYNFLTKQYTVAIQGKGKAQCAYHVEVKDDSINKVMSTYDSESVLPMVLDSFSADLPAGNYTISVKPGKPTNPNNPNIQACTGQASVNAKVAPPADAMKINSTSINVTKTNGVVLMQKDVTLPMNELKSIGVDVKFGNSMNVAHNTPNSCAYKLVTQFPQGGFSEGYYIGQGVADNNLQVASISSQGIYGKGAGVYTIRIEGTTQVPGNNHVTPCVGSSEHKVTLVATVSGLQIQQGVVSKP